MINIINSSLLQYLKNTKEDSHTVLVSPPRVVYEVVLYLLYLLYPNLSESCAGCAGVQVCRCCVGTYVRTGE